MAKDATATDAIRNFRIRSLSLAGGVEPPWNDGKRAAADCGRGEA
jgi:hypothetical protein